MLNELNKASNSITTLNSTRLWLFAFWILVFLLNMGPHWENYATIREIVETIGSIVFAQAVVALISLKFLVPKLLDKDRTVLFIVALLGLLLLGAYTVIAIRYFYIEPSYPKTYQNLRYVTEDQGIEYRLFSFWALKYIIFSKMPQLFFPTAVLMARQFYKKQSYILELKEQKNLAELAALKNQLNPHFIFNTLNNLYLLALKKSDQTPLVIEKLADILDYVVYRCNERYVSLNSEITLIQNYLDLECIRKSEKLKVSFASELNHPHTIAPLLLLNLVENACKHSTSNELNSAFVDIVLTSNHDAITFEVKNSIPEHSVINKEMPCVGLTNMSKQLEMLYPNAFSLTIDQTKDSYKATLTLNMEAS
ncbi:sensor histidine kinase [Pseudoalteromonas spongiae]|uniref:sensor histidine kinase n=1 Tax=Pseudoalteromonas spongiae TaxID=298657 RepID=UPI00110C1D3F|nr:sensor histidine kinase [Pseudoalteromonas spongiae]TMO84196.1 hypothetical protein CWC15_11350 [Pseudoalteromonas spongiae]